MSRRPPLAALEGPCCAGKTTLGHLLLRNLHGLTVAFAKCYADHAGGGRFLPRQEAHSVPEREQALRELLRVEADRLARLPSGSDLILADRSVAPGNAANSIESRSGHWSGIVPLGAGDARLAATELPGELQPPSISCAIQ